MATALVREAMRGCFLSRVCPSIRTIELSHSHKLGPTVRRSFASKSRGFKGKERKGPVKPETKPPVKPETKPPPPAAIQMSEEEYRGMFLLKHRKKNAITGAIIMVGVFAIYFYSMYAVNQDPLDDILEEVKPKTD